jgi:hypothetical protein
MEENKAWNYKTVTLSAAIVESDFALLRAPQCQLPSSNRANE